MTLEPNHRHIKASVMSGRRHRTESGHSNAAGMDADWSPDVDSPVNTLPANGDLARIDVGSSRRDQQRPWLNPGPLGGDLTDVKKEVSRLSERMNAYRREVSSSLWQRFC